MMPQHVEQAGVPASQPKQEASQLQELLGHIYREFGMATRPATPLMGVTLSMTYIGREPVVASMGDSDTPHAHALQSAAAQVRMALRKVQDVRAAALLEKAVRLIEAAEHLNAGTFFETNTKH